MTGYEYTSLATLICAAVYFWTMMTVGKMRGKHEVKAPDCTGPDEFNNAFRVNANTLEQMVLFLPCLWLFAVYVGDMWAGIAGIIWAIGRIIYAKAYIAEPSKRAKGFLVGFATFVVVFIGSLVGIIMSMNLF